MCLGGKLLGHITLCLISRVTDRLSSTSTISVFYLPISNIWVFKFSHVFGHTIFLGCFLQVAYFMSSMSPVLICISLMNNGSEHLFMVLVYLLWGNNWNVFHIYIFGLFVFIVKFPTYETLDIHHIFKYQILYMSVFS